MFESREEIEQKCTFGGSSPLAIKNAGQKTKNAFYKDLKRSPMYHKKDKLTFNVK